MLTRNLASLRRSFFALIAVAPIALGLATATAGGAGNQAVMKKSLLAGSNVPVPVRAVLQRACQDCHSENTVWPWYAHIPLISSQIHDDVEKGRAIMNLSKWNNYTEGERRGFMAAIGADIQGHLMPPPKYLWIHREARLSSDEMKSIRAWAFAKYNPAKTR
jgi:hypothetical protein